MSKIFDDKTPVVLPFILSHLSSHPSNHPFFIGLNGVQGAGKTVLVSSLHKTLSSPPHNLPTVVFSLDDLYLTHADQVALAQKNPNNPLLQHRGQPGTHDIPLLVQIFEGLKDGRETTIPKYSKSLFSGQGDRAPEAEWETVNADHSKPVRVIIFEGWCVGFQPLSTSHLQDKHSTAVLALNSPNTTYSGRLGHNTLFSLTSINESLQQYSKLWPYFNVFIHIDAADPLYVYKWRLQQEATTKRDKGSGMTDEQVKEFVDGYYPSYELYTETLRRGVFAPKGAGAWKGDGRQLRLVVGEDRKVRETVKI
jgi:D-glycerate 3-kinase